MSDNTIFTQFIDDVRGDEPANDHPRDPAPASDGTPTAEEIGKLPFGSIDDIADSVDPEQVVTKSDLNRDGDIDEIQLDLDGDGVVGQAGQGGVDGVVRRHVEQRRERADERRRGQGDEQDGRDDRRLVAQPSQDHAGPPPHRTTSAPSRPPARRGRTPRC